MASMLLVVVRYGIVLAGETYINKSDQKGIEPSPPVMIYDDWASLPLDDWSDLHTSTYTLNQNTAPFIQLMGFDWNLYPTIMLHTTMTKKSVRTMLVQHEGDSINV